ncbi:MAG: sugar transferase [Lachnospiraceae bacterium]|nr:sugar transferase [Lachnospiraceae bacterium]
MYRRRSGLQNLLILGCDIIAIMISLGIAMYIRDGAFLASYGGRSRYAVNLAPMVVFFVCSNLIVNGNQDFYIRGLLMEMISVIKNNIIIIAGCAIFSFFLRNYYLFSRLSIIYFLIIDCVLMWAIHLCLKKLIPKVYLRLLQEKSLIVVGDRDFIATYIKDHDTERNFQDIIEGVVPYDDSDIKYDSGIKGGVMEINGREYKVPVSIDGIVDYCRNASLDEIVIGSQGRTEKIIASIDEISKTGITIHYEVNIPRFKGGRHVMFRRTENLYMVTYANQITSVGFLIIKRLMDILGGILGCIILFVLTLIFAPLIKIDSKGPVFFTQERIGRNGRVFKIIKFRSMYQGAEREQKELSEKNELSGPVFKLDNDPRITKVGAFMRKTSIDEFPQFINVLKGDMSLVGTRPPTMDEFRKYSLNHKKRLSFRPGLTGLWQVSGRNDIKDFDDIVALDIEYIDNWSIPLDIKILFKTIPAMLKGR